MGINRPSRVADDVHVHGFSLVAYVHHRWTTFDGPVMRHVMKSGWNMTTFQGVSQCAVGHK